MVARKRGFGAARHAYRIVRNRQTITLINRSGDEVCSVDDAFSTAPDRNAIQTGTLVEGSLNQVWKLPYIRVPEHVVPESGWRVKESDGTIWLIGDVYLRSANMTWHLHCHHMRNHSLEAKRPN